MLPRKSESMIESLVAITVIVIATVAALSLMRTAVSGNKIIEDKVIAINLATEAINAVKNIRDTNYLRFAENADTCWKKINVEIGDDCESGSEMSEGPVYYLTRDFTTEPYFEWHLRQVDSDDDGNLSLYNIDFNHDSALDIKLYAESGLGYPGFIPVKTNVFKRTVTFSSLPTDSLNVIATVSWDENGITKEISLTGIVANVY